MTAQSPSAYAVSMTLHGLLVAALVVAAIVFRPRVEDVPRIFHLVAGEGNNYGATEAPAYGTTAAVKFEVATPPAAQPVRAEPELVAPPAEVSPVKAVAPSKTEVKPVERKIDLTQQIKKTAARAEQKVVRNYHKEQEAIARAEKAAELEKKRVTKAEFDRQNAKNAAAKSNTPIKVAQIDATGIAKGVVGGSTANKTGGAGGTALSREDQDQLDSYFALLQQRLRDAYEKAPGVSDLLSARVEFFVSAGGDISRVRILKSSGNGEFDQAVLAAFKNVASIGPRPDSKGDVRQVTFRMKEED